MTVKGLVTPTRMRVKHINFEYYVEIMLADREYATSLVLSDCGVGRQGPATEGFFSPQLGFDVVSWSAVSTDLELFSTTSCGIRLIAIAINTASCYQHW